MTLDQYRDTADKLLVPFVSAADTAGLSPNGVSVIAFGFAIAAGAAFGLADPLWYGLGAVFVFLNGWLDLVDGALAREQGVSSKAGDLLDHVLDRYADIVVLVGLAAGIDSFALGLAAVTGVLMTSYLGTQIQAVGLGRAYGGLVGRADRLALMGIAGLASAVYTDPLGGFTLVGWLLVFFAIVGHLTALQRFWGAWSDLS
ncbi:CDP-alcohol phosphatidyltransferase family protein [Haloferax mediterranei ATCC 33500]|uniref:CDP-alcohol phosphatidyltransferase family protein n=1 Tax=Haloferax mediterranei (strain ATCC 33500 / DSM 1411 / JCM 8866 / NBRC 14739 / NCIMB 2177 / R-4) TaxID=523841 RepID=I3R4B3_HALMT|nr:CDP-alcohol phosphatidyltransferase family protein [Haloferax mediterranei]AFK19073.1 CDP-diacylglycerol--glycerol-3-phosphate 3-phosphatidyl-transferase [Haloferax mediterranei ATCC 33500]AHZ21567.1 CDP-diacylglycerol--glycerol-3-phosphate 3-phosphatidyltransferase [Haloferax mediterranei ATCC 33500]EMA04030.1 CDP-diacylglycerol--glycerol-3-phosphate 3-phosphatidyltransferase [Haloferax mediterranei ATCC 33500]MDX5989165.1 CDP-alcohol phosphatidyltransferase family protein [Haloferax medite